MILQDDTNKITVREREREKCVGRRERMREKENHVDGDCAWRWIGEEKKE